ncbi:hypothetical protein BSKO_01342 [Bryopsis sp. KO-2023]|nr:hypothetical protein BSKO_01342 [Bryopsis sp. KO-2023]
MQIPAQCSASSRVVRFFPSPPRNRRCSGRVDNRVHRTHSSNHQAQDVELSDVSVALKEWSVTVAAVGDGLQTILVRKGGIREPRFSPKAENFLLFPTAFHADAKMVHPEIAEQYAKEFEFDPKKLRSIPLRQVAHVTQAWTTHDKSCLDALRGLHIWTDEYIQKRLKWQENRAITIMEVRCYTIDPPVDLLSDEDFFGCFSWVDVPASGRDQPRRILSPSIDDKNFRLCQEELRTRLESVDIHPM